MFSPRFANNQSRSRHATEVPQILRGETRFFLQYRAPLVTGCYSLSADSIALSFGLQINFLKYVKSFLILRPELPSTRSNTGFQQTLECFLIPKRPQKERKNETEAEALKSTKNKSQPALYLLTKKKKSKIHQTTDNAPTASDFFFRMSQQIAIRQ